MFVAFSRQQSFPHLKKASIADMTPENSSDDGYFSNMFTEKDLVLLVSDFVVKTSIAILNTFAATHNPYWTLISGSSQFLSSCFAHHLYSLPSKSLEIFWSGGLMYYGNYLIKSVELVTLVNNVYETLIDNNFFLQLIIPLIMLLFLIVRIVAF